MKRTILLSLALTGSAMVASAATEVYPFDMLGDMNGVSDNGQFAVITDVEQGYAYIWRLSNPEELEDISMITDESTLPDSQSAKATAVYDVADDGTVVGAITYKNNTMMPAIYKDGEWSVLPVHPNSLSMKEAMCITPDGSVIAGYQMIKDPTADQGGRMYPCQWFRQDDGEYELVAYTDMELPNHQGFYPSAQTVDGKVIAGEVYCGVGSTINALVVEGELVLFDEITTTKECLEYKGKFYTGDDENGKQTWTDDINDPNVVWFVAERINGYDDGQKEGPGFLTGFFSNCDENGNFYGSRSYVSNVDEDGKGNLETMAVIYNYPNNTWYNEEGVAAFSAGIGEDLIFTFDGRVIDGNNVESVKTAYDVDADFIINGINKISKDAKVLGGVMSEVNPATGEFQYYPFVVVIDGGTPNAVQSIAGSPKKGLVIVSAGRIEVVNAENAAVYDLNGKLISTEKVTNVAPGMYVVKAGDAGYKVCVK